MITICLGGGQTQTVVKPAEAPPAPEPTPEEVKTPEATEAKSSERKQAKTKRTGLGAYQSDLGTGDSGSGINVPV